MGENKINVGLVNMECPEFLEKAATPPAQEAGRTLSNIFYAIFSIVNYPVEKMRIKHALSLKKYEEDINNELNKISEENLVEPPLNVVGPALEASKFYIDEDELRKMFAKLIASCMNAETNQIVHNSFVEIIKQLSPLDAQNLMIIKDHGSLPIAIYSAILNNEQNSNIDLCTHVFLSNPNNNNIDRQASSISNLIRLGLINISYDSYLNNEDLYSIFYNDPKFIYYKNNIEIELKNNPQARFKSLDLKKGVIDISPLGKDFATICF